MFSRTLMWRRPSGRPFVSGLRRPSVRLPEVLTYLFVIALTSGSGAGAAPQASSAQLPKVVILATGGTIAGVQPKEGEPGYKASVDWVSLNWARVVCTGQVLSARGKRSARTLSAGRW